MYIDVIGNRPGGVAKSYDKVHAVSFAEAVALVFRNRAMYPRIERMGDNLWSVEVSNIANRITRIKVRCKRLKEPTA